ncbi:MAG: N-methyl-L-tryptophan oxidase [Rubrobacteraceae bacterium]
MKTDYEYIVAGCGGIGSGALYWLSREAGGDVLGLERFRLGHDYGGSQDHSRIIRLSYHDPAYTALSPHTFEAWHTVEEESGERLVVKTGGLDLEQVAGEPRYVDRYAGAMAHAGIAHDVLSGPEVMERFPQFSLDENVRAVYQEDAGLVDAAMANATHVALARGRGATVVEEAPVSGVRVVGDSVEVETPQGTFSGRRLLVAAGSWTNDVIRHLGREIPLTVTEEQVTYFAAPELEQFAPGRFPVWIWHGGPDYTFYGLPAYGLPGPKAGQDVGGDVVTPEDRALEPNPRILATLRGFLEKHIPGFVGPELLTKPCLYDMPPDREFVLGPLPDTPQVVVGCGAGHGYKFASFMGRMLADIALRGETRYPIDAFALDRPALTDPDYQPVFAM